MKRILILALLMSVLMSCVRKAKEVDIYRNVYVTVVDKNVFMTTGRYANPQKSILVRLDKDTTQYTELSEYLDGRPLVTDSLYYIVKPGHKLYFKFIAKKRFWTMKKY